VVTDQSGWVAPVVAAAPKTPSPVDWRRVIALGAKHGFQLDLHVMEWLRNPECQFMRQTVEAWSEDEWATHLEIASKCENWRRTGKRWKSPTVLKLIVESTCECQAEPERRYVTAPKEPRIAPDKAVVAQRAAEVRAILEEAQRKQEARRGTV
jgi:hypothetical protein